MQITTTIGALTAALATTTHAIRRRPSIPVLAGALIDAADGTATLSTFDYGTAITVPLPGDQPADGRAVVDHAFLTNTLAAIGGDADAPVTLTVDQGKVHVSASGFDVPHETLPVEDYPTLPDPVPATVSVDSGQLADAVRRILPALDADDSLPALGCVAVGSHEDMMALAATDRYRIATANLPATGAGLHDTLLFPGKLLGKLVKLSSAPTTGVGADAMWATLHMDGATVTLRLVDAEFPKTESLFPHDAPVVVTADRTQLTRLLDKAIRLQKAKGLRAMAVRMRISSGTVAIAPDVETRTPAMPAETRGASDAMTVAFTPNYLRDALKATGGKRVTVHITTPHSPVAITRDAIGDTYRHLLMPIRIN